MARILLIGPERQRAASVRSLLRQDGHQVVWLRGVDRWRIHEREVQPDLVLATVSRPDSVLRPAPRRGAMRFPAPLLMLQQESDFVGSLHDDERLIDRLASPFMSEELLGRVDALSRVRSVVRRGRIVEGSSAQSGGLRGVGNRVSSWLRTRMPRDERPRGPYIEVAARVAEWTDRRDAFEQGHSERVSSFSGMIAEGLGLGENETTSLLRAAMLHDIGKVGLPYEILHQKQPLEEQQMRLIRTHPARGAVLLRALDSEDDVAKVVLCHHERPDGAGYYGRQRAVVPRAAFALAVAEAYDAMTSSQLRAPLGRDQALQSLTEQKGQAYDGDCVEALVDSLKPRGHSVDMSRSLPLSSTYDGDGGPRFAR